MKLLVTIPAQNEEKTIARVVRGVPRDIPGIDEVQVLVMDDESTDGTARCAREAGAIVLPVSGRPGLGRVFQQGIESAMRLGADFVVNIDGDGQFDPADIPQLVEPLIEDRADFVTCSRFKNADFRPHMPAVKFWGNWAIVRIVNSVCGGSQFTDVSCGFRAFNRDALYRLTLFGRYTYTQECFIDLFAKGARIVEVPLQVRGVREHGESRVARSVWKYATHTFPIILRAMRDIRPLKFFGLIGTLLALPALALAAFVSVHYLQTGHTTPYTSLITVGGALMTLAFVMGMLALLADMMARHRRITEELLYIARRRMYAGPGLAVEPLSRAVDRGVEPVLPGVSTTQPAARPVLPAASPALARVRPQRSAPLEPVLASVADDSPGEDQPLHAGGSPARAAARVNGQPRSFNSNGSQNGHPSRNGQGNGQVNGHHPHHPPHPQRAAPLTAPAAKPFTPVHAD